MSQYTLSGNSLTLNVKKSPLFILCVMYLFAFLFFVIPIVVMVLLVASHSQIKFFHIIMIIGFGFMGRYMLKIALWNTCGSERIDLNKNSIKYESDFGWFKGSERTIEIHQLEYSIDSVGYEEDNLGLLVIGSGEESSLRCVTKMPLNELEKLISFLER